MASGRKIILAIDDQAENLSRTKTMLEGFFDVRLAKSAKQALKILQLTKVDLILLDIEMPTMSGFEFLKQYRGIYPENKDTPVIFVTAHADTEIINQAINLGAKDYIVKPVNAEKLHKKIDGVIGMPTDKTLLNPTEEKAKHLLGYLAAGDSTRIDNTMTELINITRGQNANSRRYVEDIQMHISKIDYEKASSKVKEFISYLQLNRRTEAANAPKKEQAEGDSEPSHLQ